jgi:molybdate transport system substrate-binding protein
MPPEAPSIRLFSTLAVLALLQDMAPDFERRTGLVLATTFDPTQRLLARLQAGESADAVILTRTAIDALAQHGTLRPGSAIDLARSLVGMAVAKGAPRPDIATPAALKRTLLEAPSIAYSRAGASGIFFAALIEQLGIAAAVNAKATVIPAGFTAELVARGEAVLAIQQVSELMAVKGVDIVGPLPPELQTAQVFSGGVLAAAANPAGGAALLAYLAEACTATLLREAGLEPA